MTEAFVSNQTRQPAVAGMFYPNNPGILKKTVLDFLAAVPASSLKPRALIVPHAGYVYSGQVAACAYQAVENIKDQIKTVVLIGPGHRYPIDGIASCSYQSFGTPLGKVTVNADLMEIANSLPFVTPVNEAHLQEHCLEVQLPFLQLIFDDIQIVPLLAGKVNYHQIDIMFDKLSSDQSVLIIVSSDLSHYLSYQEAIEVDSATSQAIEALNEDLVYDSAACGSVAVKGLLSFAKRHKLKVDTLCLANSGDTAGSKNEVVGYGAYAFS